jgi:hypothetical protein
MKDRNFLEYSRLAMPEVYGRPHGGVNAHEEP